MEVCFHFVKNTEVDEELGEGSNKEHALIGRKFIEQGCKD